MAPPDRSSRAGLSGQNLWNSTNFVVSDRRGRPKARLFRRHRHPPLIGFQLWHDLLSESPYVALGIGVVHVAVAEDAAERVGAAAVRAVDDLVVALLGRAPDLQAQEELHHG